MNQREKRTYEAPECLAFSLASVHCMLVSSPEQATTKDLDYEDL